jgi:hypothetical protein
METRIPIIEQIADGEPVVRTEIPVVIGAASRALPEVRRSDADG